MNSLLALAYICAVRWFISLFILVVFSFSTKGQDSLISNLAADMTNVAESIGADTLVKKAKGTLAMPKTIEGKSRASNKNGRNFFLGLGVFLLFGLLRYAYQKYIDALFSTLARSTLWRLSSNERLWQNVSQRLFFLVIYFLSVGYIIGRFIDVYGQTKLGEFPAWMLGAALTLGAFIIKFLILRSVALVFRFSKLANAFFRHLMVINQVLGIILLPVCGILLLTPSKMAIILLFVAVAMLAISIVFKYVVNMAYVRNMPKVNYVQFIVYLCTLEFIPLAVLVRYAYDGFGV